MPDAQEAQQVMETLALSGATAVVAAMATDAWQATRRGMARLFSRGGGAVPAVEAQLDGDAEIVERDEDTDGARQDLVGPWRRRLLALLRQFPEAQADLMVLIEQIRGELPQAEQNWVQANLARGHGIVNAVQHGTQYTFYMDSGNPEGRPE